MRSSKPTRPSRWPVGVSLIVFAGILAFSNLGSSSYASTKTSTKAGTQRVQAAPAMPGGALDQGGLPTATRVHLSIMLKPADPAGLVNFAEAVSTPGSPEYHDFLARHQFAARFGPTPATIHAVISALRHQGLHPGRISSNHLDIPIVTTTARAETAFATHIDRVRLSDGRSAYANVTAPSLPASIASSVQAIIGLDNLTQAEPAGGGPTGQPSLRANVRKQVGFAFPNGGGPGACGAAVSTGAATATDLASGYRFSGLYAKGDFGAGITVALVELSDYADSDIATYQSCFGTSASVTRVLVDGGAPFPGANSSEPTGDIETVIGLAPRSSILTYESPNTLSGILDDDSRIVSDDTAQVISTSWGVCEQSVSGAFYSSENTLLQQAATQGQTFLSASGDGGSECHHWLDNPSDTSLSVYDPGSQPFVTGVGGTSLSSLNPPIEVVWDGQGFGGRLASTGGISALWPMPSWQSAPGVFNTYSSGAPCGAASGDCREVPDVSALAGSPFYAGYCTSGPCSPGGWGGGGGTSLASPLWAALVALADSACSPGTSVGFMNPTLYQLAAAGRGDFNDITVGNNDITGTNGGAYPATPGYDMTTGLGSPNATRLAGDLCPNAAPQVTSASTAAAAVNQAFNFVVTAAGHPTPAITETTTAGQTGLPPGLRFTDNTDGTAAISGAPSIGANGTFTFNLTASNGAGPPATQVFTLTTGFVITTTSLPIATRGVAYSLQLQATGGATPIKWKRIGTLPKGLKLKSTGLLSGTPKTNHVSPGTYTFTVQATTKRSKGHPSVMTTQTLTLTLL